MGLIVVVGLGMGFGLVNIPSSPAFHLEQDDISEGKRQARKLCVMSDVDTRAVYLLRKPVMKSKVKAYKNKEFMKDLIVIALSLCCFSAKYPANMNSEGANVLTVLQLFSVLIVTILLGILRTRDILKYGVSFNTIFILFVLATRIIEHDNKLLALRISDVVQTFGVIIKTMTTQVLLYTCSKKSEVTSRASMFAIILVINTVGEDLYPRWGGSPFMLSNCLILSIVVVPRLFQMKR